MLSEKNQKTLIRAVGAKNLSVARLTAMAQDEPFTSKHVQAALKKFAAGAHRRAYQPDGCDMALIDSAILSWLEPATLGPCLRYCANLNT